MKEPSSSVFSSRSGRAHLEKWEEDGSNYGAASPLSPRNHVTWVEGKEYYPPFLSSFRESATLEARRGARNHFLSACCTVCSAFTAGAQAVGGKMRRKEGKGGRTERKEGKGKMKTLDRLTHRGGGGRQGEEGRGTLTKDLLLSLLLLLLLPCSFLPRRKRMPKEFEKLSSCAMLYLPLPVFFPSRLALEFELE